MAIRYEADNITRVRYEAEPGQGLRVVAEATSDAGDTSIFEVNLGRVTRFMGSGVEISRRRKRGRYKDLPNPVVSWEDLRTGDAIINALNGRGGLVKRLGTF